MNGSRGRPAKPRFDLQTSNRLRDLIEADLSKAGKRLSVLPEAADLSVPQLWQLVRNQAQPLSIDSYRRILIAEYVLNLIDSEVLVRRLEELPPSESRDYSVNGILERLIDGEISKAFKRTGRRVNQATREGVRSGVRHAIANAVAKGLLRFPEPDPELDRALETLELAFAAARAKRSIVPSG